jgi:hypothetical protein
MAGNDKAGVLGLEWHGRNWKLQRNFFSNPGNSTGIGHLWHLPGQNAPARNSKNAKCDLMTIPLAVSVRSTGKVTREPDLQSARGRISSLSWKIIVLF